MAEESSRGRNRRRYFRRKGGDKPQAQGQPKENQIVAAQPAREEVASAERRARVNRRKRRGRKSKGGEPRVDVAVSSERDVEYRAPDSVFIYTHIVRPVAGAYEFRAESFSKVGHTLEEYQIDIDPLFAPPDKEAQRQAIREALADWDYGEEESAGASATPPQGSDASALQAASEPADFAPQLPAAQSPATQSLSPESLAEEASAPESTSPELGSPELGGAELASPELGGAESGSAESDTLPVGEEPPAAS